MKIICEECGSTYKIKDELVKGKISIKTQCPKCKFIQKNELIKEKESNPFEDNSKTVDFIASVKNKEQETSSEINDLGDKEENKDIADLPDIDLNSLQKEEIKERINKNKNLKEEDNKSDNLESESKNGLYSAKKGSSFLGPFTLEEMKSEIKKRKITKEFLFSKDGDDWKTIEYHKELLPYFKNYTKNNHIVKYLIIGVVLIGIAFLIVSLLDKFTNDDYNIIEKDTYSVKKGATPLKNYIDKWKKTIILTKDSDSIIYTEAIQNFYSDSSNLYIKSINQFKEVLIKNPLKYDAFYYMILSLSFSDIEIESNATLKKYLKTLKSIKNPQKHNELYYNALSALSIKLEAFVDSFNYAKQTKNIVSNNAISNYLLARFYFNSRKLDKTIKFLKIAIKSEDRLIIAKKFLAEVFIDSLKFREAIAFYEKIDTVFSKFVLSRIYLKIGFYDKSFSILKKLSKDKKNRLENFNILYARLLYQYKNKRKSALRILKRIEKNNLFKLSKKDKVSVLNNIAIIYRLNRKFVKSIKYSQKILEIDKNNKVAKFNLILIRIEQKKYKEASILIQQFNKSTKNADKYNYLISLELFSAQGKYKKAIKETRQIINLERYNNLYYIILANIYSKDNNLNMVHEVLSELNTINPDYYINNGTQLTDFYIKKVNLKSLIDYLELLLKDKKTDKALLLNNLGLLYYQLKKFKKARFYFTKSMEISKTNISNYIYLAYINYHSNRYNDVIAVATEAYEVRGKSLYLYLIHIKALLKFKKIKEANKVLKMAQYDFKYSNVVKLMRALIYIEDEKDSLAKNILSEIKNDFKYDLSYKKFLFSLNY